MKHFLLFPLLLLCLVSSLSAQTAPGPVEQKVTDNICDCITNLDMEKIKNKATADKAFMGCFTNQAGLIVQLAEERNVEITDQEAMKGIGVDIGKNLFRQECQGFMQLSVAMAGGLDAQPTSGETEGKLKRIDTKDFSYFVLVDGENKEKSFIWLRQFPGSEVFFNGASKHVGKKLNIKWQEMEVYIPAAKNYYTVKEVVALEVL